VIFPPSASFSAATFFDLLRETEAEYLLTVPAINIACRQAWDGHPVDSVRVAVSTSAPTPPAQRQWLREMFPRAALSAGSGISESLNMAFQSPQEFLSHPDSVGEPYLDTRVRIVDPAGRTLPAGVAGEICLRGFNTGLSYHLEPDKSTATWRRIADDPEELDWCFTGDIGVLDDQGRLSIVDRAKDVIISGGETIPSVEIEGLFQEHPVVRECAAIGMPDERWGELVTLVVAPAGEPGDLRQLTAELGAFARERIAPYKRPRRFIYVDALPRSHFGKVLKRTLRDMTHTEVYEEIDISGDASGRPAQSM
jgi:fatty-acyl-CoA synthase